MANFAIEGHQDEQIFQQIPLTTQLSNKLSMFLVLTGVFICCFKNYCYPKSKLKNIVTVMKGISIKLV